MTDPSDTPASGADEANWEAVARFLAGECSPAEAEALRGWVGAAPERARMVAGLEAALGKTDYAPPAGLDVESALHKVRARLHTDSVIPISAARSRRAAEIAGAAQQPAADVVAAPSGSSPRRTMGWSWYAPRVAAALLLVAGSAWFLRSRPAGTGSAERTVATAIGQRQAIALPDGSSAILGPSSELVIVAGYAEGTRTVRLKGEALFTVSHDAAHPFAVETQGTRITDVGTEFSVSSDAETGVTVAVREGAVELRKSADGAPAQLNKGDRAVVGRDASAMIVRGGASDDDFAFTRGALVFRDSPIAEVVADVRRWYGVEIVPGTVAMSSSHVTATFSNESRAEALNVIALALGAVVEMRGDSALLRPRILRPPR
jgi:transmembrane sensor